MASAAATSHDSDGPKGSVILDRVVQSDLPSIEGLLERAGVVTVIELEEVVLPLADRCVVVTRSDRLELVPLDVRTVAILTSAGTTAHRDALRRGAFATCDLVGPAELVVDVVLHAMRGRVLAPSDVVHDLARRTRSDDCTCRRLSSEQVEIVQWLMEGRSVAAIAARTHRSERDCYRRMRDIWATLNASGRTAGIAHLLRCGLIGGD